jgi:hypothetical protein
LAILDITKKQNEKIAFVAVTAILAISVMASIGILSSAPVQDTEGKNRHANIVTAIRIFTLQMIRAS